MEKRLTLDQFKKSVGTQDLELQKLAVRGLGTCHPQTNGQKAQQTADSIAVQVIKENYKRLTDAFGL